MRLKINFHAERLPIIYRHRFMALIKEALTISSPEYKSYLYPENGSENSKIPKPFSFAILLPKDRKLTKKHFYIDQNTKVYDYVFEFPSKTISFLITSHDYYFLINLWNGIVKMKTFDIENEITIKLKNATLMKEKNIEGEVVKFRTLSPVLVEDKLENPLLPDSPHFNENLNIIQNKRLEKIRGYGLISPLELRPISIKKSVVKHTLNGFRETTSKPYMFLTCFEGTFYLFGDPVDLKYIYQCGLGLRTGQGFGMLEVV